MLVKTVQKPPSDQSAAVLAPLLMTPGLYPHPAAQGN